MKIGGKKLFFFFDTCYSGNVLPGSRAPDSLPNVDKFANELKAAENGIILFDSSTETNCRRRGANGIMAPSPGHSWKGCAALRPALIWRQFQSPICMDTSRGA